MKALLESLLPLGIFFVCYQYFDLYVATAALLGFTLLSLLINCYFNKRKHHKVDKINGWQLASSGCIIVTASATLLLHEPWFIKLKPTLVYWLLALSFVVCRLWWRRCPTLVELMLREWPQPVGLRLIRKLELLWGGSFALLGLLNLGVAAICRTEIWVKFKIISALGLMLIVGTIQAIWLARSDASSTKDK